MISPETIQMTKHAAEQQLKRGIRDVEVSLAIDFGHRLFGTGVEYRFLGRDDIPDWVDRRYAERAAGTVVILAPDGTVRTTYRNGDCLKELRRRSGRPRKAHNCR